MRVRYRDVPGHPGYRVGDDGSVWSRKSWRGRTPEDPRGRRLSSPPGKHGYRVVRLTAGLFYVHHLVLLAFVGPVPAGYLALHKNGDRTNANLSNLYYGTHAQNMLDMVRHNRSTRGERNRHAKLTADIVKQIREDSSDTNLALGVKYGVSDATISDIKRRRSWAHV